MAKSAPTIRIKTSQKYKGPGWNGEKVEPYKQPTPQKTFDPRKDGTTGIFQP